MSPDGYSYEDEGQSCIEVTVAIAAGVYLRTAAVARRLGVSRQSVRWLAAVGRLGYIPSPFGHLYLEEHIQRYLRKRAQLWNNRRGRRGEPRK